MENFLKSYGTLILAVYGIVQVWIIALWKRYALKGKINIYETGNIEIGYTAFGPTIGLNGTLRALNKDVFIKVIDLLIIREKDRAQHIFKWFAFRSPKIDLAGIQPPPMEIPSGFLVSTNSPYRFSIVFNDNDLLEGIRSLFHKYVSEWYKVINQLSKIWPPPQSDLKLIKDFRNSEIYLEMYTALDRKCYWEPGDYSLIMNVRTSNPDKVFNKNYKFSITEADSENLKLNVIAILEEPILSYLRIPNYYYFAYSTLERSR